jgi:hypothetical protein
VWVVRQIALGHTSIILITALTGALRLLLGPCHCRGSRGDGTTFLRWLCHCRGSRGYGATLLRWLHHYRGTRGFRGTRYGTSGNTFGAEMRQALQSVGAGVQVFQGSHKLKVGRMGAPFLSI